MKYLRIDGRNRGGFEQELAKKCSMEGAMENVCLLIVLIRIINFQQK